MRVAGWFKRRMRSGFGSIGAATMALDYVNGPADGVSTDNALVRWDGTTGRLVQNSGATLSDTGDLVLPTTGSVQLQNATGVNFERLRIQAVANNFEVLSEIGGSGTLRDVRIGSSATQLRVGATAGLYTLIGTSSGLVTLIAGNSGTGVRLSGLITTGTVAAVELRNGNSLTASSAAQLGAEASFTINQSGTAGYTLFRINGVETATGSGNKFFFTAGLAGANTVTLSTAGTFSTPGSTLCGGNLAARNTTAIPAGGTTGQGITFFSTSNFGFFGGSGAPSLSAAKGSLYLRSDGSGVNDRIYVNTDGGTTWTALVSVA